MLILAYWVYIRLQGGFWCHFSDIYTVSVWCHITTNNHSQHFLLTGNVVLACIKLCLHWYALSRCFALVASIRVFLGFCNRLSGFLCIFGSFFQGVYSKAYFIDVHKIIPYRGVIREFGGFWCFCVRASGTWWVFVLFKPYFAKCISDVYSTPLQSLQINTL